MNRQARQKGKYIMKKTFYKYTNKILVAMQLNVSAKLYSVPKKDD